MANFVKTANYFLLTPEVKYTYFLKDTIQKTQQNPGECSSHRAGNPGEWSTVNSGNPGECSTGITLEIQVTEIQMNVAQSIQVNVAVTTLEIQVNAAQS